jgi:hypothetical protein
MLHSRRSLGLSGCNFQQLDSWLMQLRIVIYNTGLHVATLNKPSRLTTTIISAAKSWAYAGHNSTGMIVANETSP